MKSALSKLSVAVLALNCLALVFGQEVPKLLPFQGRLTDVNGNAIAGGSKVVQFKIYNAPVGGQAVWNGEVQKLSINEGLVSTTLGTKASLADVDFNQNLYLELTIDANDDNQISAADPPLLPRQSIVPVVFANESGNSRKLVGHDWSSILVSGNDPANGFIRGDKLNANSITAAQIASKTITANQIADATITASQMAANTITSGQIADGTITSEKLSAVLALNAASLTSGTLSDARLSPNVALRSGGNTFNNNQIVNGGFTVNGTHSVSGNTGIGAAPPGPLTRLRVAGGVNQQEVLMVDGSYSQGTWLSIGNSSFGGSRWSIVSTGSGNSEGAGRLLFFTHQVGDTKMRLETNGHLYIDGSFHDGSDRNRKENFTPVDPKAILDQVATLPITRWNYKDEASTAHIGPVAQDFKATFGLGSEDTSIANVDAHGVALAAIQGLNQKLEEITKAKDARIAALEEQNAALSARLSALERFSFSLDP